MKIKSLLLPIIALSMTAASSHAATIVFGFGTAIAEGANLGAGSIATSNGFSGDGITVSNWTASSPVRNIRVSGGQVQALKSEDTDTHAFTITIPNLAGSTVDLTSLSFNYGEFGNEGAAMTWTISSSIGSISPNSGTTPSNSSSFANLALSGLTGLNNTSVTFTLLDTSQGNNKNWTFYTWIDNVTLTGVVNPAIPETSSVFLGSIGMLFLLRRRRK